MITLDDYMSAEKFPTTTQDDLSPLDQFFIDSANYDALKRVKLEGRKFSDHQDRIWEELNKKIPAQQGLKAEAEIASEAYEDCY